MARLLEGKVAAITGGLTGIGRAIAIEFARQGAKVAVNHLGQPAEEQHQRCLCKEVGSENSHDEFPLYFYAGDISDPDVAEAFLASTAQHFGHLDIVVANAGVARFHDFLSTPDAFIQQHLQVNVCGTYYIVRAAGRIMKEQDTGGSIIGISSVSALTGSGGLVHYTPTKAAVLNLMQSSAVALGPYGIRCNALLPGTIKTRLNVDDLAQNDKQKEVEQRTCLKRVGLPVDIAGPAVFLASDLSQYVTGAQLLVDGGLFVNLQ
ncbi:peroxisomal 2,4-dienoyl-CoA reductase, auxiliary enzyme of fatty acid beta-oxidation [Exophiala viscosa]|uniref:peroxisomal 2,4-dienoyl-CoA reductase, auxiliary enzyme of fatty acid beta-oxidation n=1 Tax=Exophiala viscosa TaxID=2486360 RepID=UPI00219DC280|nr:peroxisomal 2,4-dienoyl-CoA reductase, auxiliary enzyme of fatty acid beta-oxidation [Exophiala viscosa]